MVAIVYLDVVVAKAPCADLDVFDIARRWSRLKWCRRSSKGWLDETALRITRSPLGSRSESDGKSAAKNGTKRGARRH